MWEKLLTDFWGFAAVFVAGILYMIIHRGAAVSQAKKTAMTLMLGAEKRAEHLLLVTGQDKFNWVVDKGYDILPAALRMFISKPAFRNIVQELFDGSVQMAKQYVKDDAGGQAYPQTAAPTPAGIATAAIPLPPAGMSIEAPYGYNGSVPIHPGMPPVPPMPMGPKASGDGAPV